MPAISSNFRLVLSILLPALGGMTFLFRDEIAAAIHIWDTSTAYGHCWLVLPLAVWLLWERRAVVIAVGPSPNPWLAILALPVALIWFAAYLLGIMEGRQLAAVACVEILFLAMLGPRLWWLLSSALLYLIFLVPFGAFVTPMLQDFTASFVAHGLDIMHIPGQVTGYRIEIPEGQFYIAEACAGLRFLIASIAFGVLYAVTMFRSPLRRAIFIVASILVPIVANGFRALGIVVLGHELGSAQAAETDHVLYGWIFFSIVILLLTLAGTPFRQTAEAPPTGTPSKSPVALMRVLATTIAVLLVSASGPVIALLLDSGTGTAPNASRVLLTPSGCSIIAAHDAGPVSDSEFDCGGARIIVRLEIVPAGSKPSRVIDAARDQITGLMQDTETENGEIITFPGKPSRWIARHDRGGHKSAASSVFIDGHAGDGSLADRLVLSRDLLTGRGCASAAVVVAAATRTTDATSTLRDFLAYQGDLEARIGRLARCGTATSIPDSKSSGDRGLW